MRPRLIAKFGGSSLANPSTWKLVRNILRERRALEPLVVVSALGVLKEKGKASKLKVTDRLLRLAELKSFRAELESLKADHLDLLSGLELPVDLLDDAFEELAQDLRDRPAGPEGLDRIAGWGELLSSQVMAAYLRQDGWNARAALPEELGMITGDQFQDASVLEESLNSIAQKVIQSRELLVVPGFVGVTHDGRRTTLGRGGSDYTAAVLGAALKRDVEIWTDVDGVAATDPGVVDKPITVSELSHEEAYQMAAFGSRVLYQKCLAAARLAAKRGRHLKMVVKNTFNPYHPGTVIVGHSSPDGVPKGVTALEGVQLLTVYLDREEDYRGLWADVADLAEGRLLMASYATGRASFVFDRLSPGLEELETRYSRSHLSRDQVLIKVVGDGIGINHSLLARIHQSIDALENPEKWGAPLVHKSPQLLTDATFEFVALKRGARELIVRLYKDLFDPGALRVGLLGLGTVAGGMLQYARELYSREKTGVDLHFPVAVVRSLDKARNFDGELTQDPAAVLDNRQIDVVVELMGGIEPARTHILAALQNGKHVITANKAVLAEHGPEIFAAARKYRRNLGFEGSVCGEIPVIEMVQKMPSDQDVEAITGILNGTSNYLLTRMADGSDYGDALREAQESGFAEADPTLDVSGADAAQKLSILASLVFHTPVSWRSIRLQGIESIRAVDTAEAARLSLSLRPVARAVRHAAGLELWVGPALVEAGHSLYAVRRETNAVSLRLQGREEPLTLVGKGAGALPTARSVVRDLLEVARRERFRMVDIPAFHEGAPVPVLPHSEHVYPWWVRFTVQDQPGVFGAVAALLGSHGLSIRQASQQEGHDGVAHIFLALKPARRGTLDTALEHLGANHGVVATLCLPVLS